MPPETARPPPAPPGGKRSTPPLRCPTASVPVYGHEEAGSAPGQSARAAGASSTKAAAPAGIRRLQGIDSDQHPRPRKVALGRARKESCRSLIPDLVSVDAVDVETSSPGSPRRAPRQRRRRPPFGLRYALAGVATAWAAIAA